MTVNAPQITDTFSAGIKLSDSSDDPSVNASAVNEIYIRDPVITFLVPEAHHERLRAHGIWIFSPAEILRNVVITGCYIRGQTAYGVMVQPSAGGVRSPLILHGWVKNEGSGVFGETAGDVDIHNLLQAV